MPQTYSTIRRIEFRDTDAAGIAHFSVFFTWMEEAEHELLRTLGMSVVGHDEQGEIGWPRVSASCDYASAVKFEDELNITVRLESLGDRSVTFAFRFAHDRREVAEGRMTSVCCRIVPGEPPEAIAIPESMREQLQSLLGE